MMTKKNNNTATEYQKNHKERDSLWDMAKTAFLAVILALLIRSVAFEPFNIPSGSMIPTLLVGDYLFVSKYSYGYSRYSFPLGLINFEGRIFADEPERGDVAVFRQPTRTDIDFIKRIIGLPGDRIQVKQGILYINDTPIAREMIGLIPMDDAFGRLTHYTQYKEILPNGVTHNIIESSDEDRYDNTPVYIVPKDHYFVMGDNRDSSQDSRAKAQVGFVPFQNLVGRAEFIFFSTDGSAKIYEFWRWPSATRFERLFKAIR